MTKTKGDGLSADAQRRLSEIADSRTRNNGRFASENNGQNPPTANPLNFNALQKEFKDNGAIEGEEISSVLHAFELMENALALGARVPAPNGSFVYRVSVNWNNFNHHYDDYGPEGYVAELGIFNSLEDAEAVLAEFAHAGGGEDWERKKKGTEAYEYLKIYSEPFVRRMEGKSNREVFDTWAKESTIDCPEAHIEEIAIGHVETRVRGDF